MWQWVIKRAPMISPFCKTKSSIFVEGFHTVSSTFHHWRFSVLLFFYLMKSAFPLIIFNSHLSDSFCCIAWTVPNHTWFTFFFLLVNDAWPYHFIGSMTLICDNYLCQKHVFDRLHDSETVQVTVDQVTYRVWILHYAHMWLQLAIGISNTSFFNNLHNLWTLKTWAATLKEDLVRLVGSAVVGIRR